MAPRRPALVIVGGINGCGKSTFAVAAAADPRAPTLGLSAINPDDLTRAVVAEFPRLAGDAANLVGVERAEKHAWMAIARGESVAIETVLSTPKLIPVVEAAVTRRYRTRLVFIGLPSVELAIERVAKRVAEGGHGVPEDRLRARWERTHDNLLVYLSLVDDVLIYSNATTSPALVAELVGRSNPLRLILPNELPAVSERLTAQ